MIYIVLNRDFSGIIKNIREVSRKFEKGKRQNQKNDEYLTNMQYFES
jgi:hypothetical protein